MSIEVSQRAIEHAYNAIGVESVRDAALVIGTVMEAEQKASPMDGAFSDELADKRWQQAVSEYEYPVPHTGPTRASSLRIVKDIIAIRELEATAGERLADIYALGADVRLVGALGLERNHRLWEKGVLRIFDQHTRTSMWSVDFDDALVARKDPADGGVRAMTDLLVRHHSERPRS